MKHGQKQAPALSQEQLEKTLASCVGPHASRDQAIILVSHYLGLRAKELASLKLSNIYDEDWKMRQIVQLVRAQTKGEKSRKVPLVHPRTREILSVYIEQRKASKEVLTEDSPLFLSQKSHEKIGEVQGHFCGNTMQKLIKRIYARANVQASSHSGRVSYANRLIRKNRNIYDIMTLMGHQSITTTQMYFRTSDDRLISAASDLD